MSFKEWMKLKENMTSTACVASFVRPIMTVNKKKPKSKLDDKVK